jgi:hypothetical protein
MIKIENIFQKAFYKNFTLILTHSTKPRDIPYIGLVGLRISHFGTQFWPHGHTYFLIQY